MTPAIQLPNPVRAPRTTRFGAVLPLSVRLNTSSFGEEVTANLIADAARAKEAQFVDRPEPDEIDR